MAVVIPRLGVMRLSKRRKHSEEFKHEAVRLLDNCGERPARYNRPRVLDERQ
jgi:hypothetical protein